MRCHYMFEAARGILYYCFCDALRLSAAHRRVGCDATVLLEHTQRRVGRASPRRCVEVARSQRPRGLLCRIQPISPALGSGAQRAAAEFAAAVEA